jgi:hypothetical protein
MMAERNDWLPTQELKLIELLGLWETLFEQDAYGEKFLPSVQWAMTAPRKPMRRDTDAWAPPQ